MEEKKTIPNLWRVTYAKGAKKTYALVRAISLEEAKQEARKRKPSDCKMAKLEVLMFNNWVEL